MSYRDRERGTKIYVGNLSSSTTRSDLEYEFSYYGHLVNVWVAKNPPGFSYVEFEDSRDADDAIKGLDGRELHGRRIRVERSHGIPRSRRDDSGGRFGGRRPFHPTDRCYNCGENGHYAYDCDLYSRRSRGSERRGRRSHSRSRSRTPRRRSRRSPSYSRSRSRSRRRSPSRSRSRSRSASAGSRSRSRDRKSRDRRSRSGSRSPSKKRHNESDDTGRQNGKQSPSKSRSRSRSR